jgi:glutathione-specific gamma-glutamylcyclotransferase
MAGWDAALGVWKGSKAATSLSSELPNPLYIFGYGSLLWRPGDLLSKYPAYPCVCYGWKRLFAQRSMDHRGTTHFPGFVATLVSDSYFSQQDDPDAAAVATLTPPPSECVGIAFLVPHDEAGELIAELDYREKGGYHRHIIPVKLLEQTPHHNQFDHANALVYTGPTDNPNFSLELASSHWETQIARIVSVSVGPSGENSEYLLQLAAFVSQQVQHDDYLTHLANKVFETMCSWRGRWVLRGCNQFSENHLQTVELVPVSPFLESESGAGQTNDPIERGPLLLGWGSNEASQLNGVKSFRSHFSSSSLALGDATSPPSHLVMTPTLLGFFFEPISEEFMSPYPLYSPSLFRHQVYAGGSRSAVQFHTRLYLWGDLQDSHSGGRGRGPHRCWKKTFSLSDDSSLVISQEEVLIDSLVQSSSPPYEAMVFNGVESIAMGHRHNLLLSHDRTTVLAFGDDSALQCSDRDSPFTRPPPSPLSSLPTLTKLTVAKLSAGLLHSALLTTSGLVYTWGDHSRGQCLPKELTPWRAPVITVSEDRYCGVLPRVLDLSCGAHHTVLIDTIGRIFTFGDNK